MSPQVDYDGVPTATDVKAMLEEKTRELYQFRNAFRIDQEAATRNSDSVEFPSGGTFEGEMVEVEKGGDYPRAKLDYDGAVAAYSKYGFEVPITDEDIKDSKINFALDNQQQMAREEQRRLDAIAFSILDANRNGTVIGTDGTDFNYEATVAAYTALVDAGFSADSLVFFLSPDAWGDMATSSEFMSDTETFAEELRSTGPNIGQVMGRPAMLTNTGNLGADEAFVVDTSRYGWESERDPFEVSRYREDQKDQWVYKERGRIDWVPTESDAAMFIQGGV
ncbi:phage major capsid protein [Halomarina oriensis]|uniref:Phage major capsid protein n=1 Tax=Halomarina oriensis TaxID=671145 RepID=A0A6B0GMD6_9EURY|nr:hypothetical protein [Halomarina oriensis]MWG34827.1 hypothetical protein [Halomarina oriensis]